MAASRRRGGIWPWNSSGEKRASRRFSSEQRFDPLAEDDRLASAGGAFFEVGLQPLEFAALAGGRIEVADLLQPQHQLEHVLDRDELPFHSRAAGSRLRFRPDDRPRPARR